jgi:bifunctional NMN adenylyltransferase/nudix hydrolase
MMKDKLVKSDVGIIVARFQIHNLHDSHIELIDSVAARCDKVIIFLGLSPLRNTYYNPLDFRSRKTMLHEKYKNIEVYYVDNHRDDVVWSKNLDNQIKKWTNPNQSVILYGSRDSFISHYKGKYKTQELESNSFISGTEVRRIVCNNYPPDESYRAGMIAATASRFPTAYQTVDVAIIKDDTQLLLVRKPDDSCYMFLGGFSSPESNSLEEDVVRETQEEAGIEIGDINYIGSCKINDWRYRGEKDCIKTAFFYAKYVFGTPEGNDDVCEAKWFDIKSLREEVLMEGHRPLLKMLKEIFDGY